MASCGVGQPCGSNLWYVTATICHRYYMSHTPFISHLWYVTHTSPLICHTPLASDMSHTSRLLYVTHPTHISLDSFIHDLTMTCSYVQPRIHTNAFARCTTHWSLHDALTLAWRSDILRIGLWRIALWEHSCSMPLEVLRTRQLCRAHASAFSLVF